MSGEGGEGAEMSTDLVALSAILLPPPPPLTPLLPPSPLLPQDSRGEEEAKEKIHFEVKEEDLEDESILIVDETLPEDKISQDCSSN